MSEPPIKTAAPTSAQTKWLARVLGLVATTALQKQDGPGAGGGSLEAFNKRLAGVIATLKPALAAQHPGALDAKLKVSEAGVFARKQDFVQAHALLDDAEAMLAHGQDVTQKAAPTFQAAADAGVAKDEAGRAKSEGSRLDGDAVGVGIGQVTPPTVEAAAPPNPPSQDAIAPQPPQQPNPAAASPNADALSKALADLIRRIPEAAGAAPALKAKLAKLATDANVNIKTNNLRYAADFITQLRDSLQNAQGAAGVGWVTPPSGAGAQPPLRPVAAAAEPLVTWRDAKEAANMQVAKLQDAMRALQHPLFERLADQGLNGITGRLQVGLQVALMEVTLANGDARKKAQEKARAAIADFRGFLQTDPVLPLLESNPLGVAITLRADLGQALDTIDRALAA